MIFKILLILTLIFTFIKINGGVNYSWETDNQEYFIPSHDFLGESPSPDEQMFQELGGTPVDLIDEDMHGQSSTTEIQNIPMDVKTREQWVQDIFVKEHQSKNEYMVWNDLRNHTHLQSWPVLCYQLWDKHPNVKKGQECSINRYYDPLIPKFNYRVYIPNNDNRYKVDLLQCKCPKNSRLSLRQQTVSYSGLFFFVTPCTAFHNSYYIIRIIRRASLEVFDIRNTIFSPAYDIHLPTTETNVQTFSRPGTIGNDNESEDELEKEKLAKTKFVEEFSDPEIRKPWDDLRNEAYEHLWPKFCFQLLDNEISKRTGKSCRANPLHEKRRRFMRQRVVDPRVTNRMYVDLLQCNCPKSENFYVTKSFKGENYYYLIRLKSKDGSDLEVYDLRSVSLI